MRRIEVGLLTRFSVLSFVAVLVLGLVLSHQLRSDIQKSAVDEVTKSADLIRVLTVQHTLNARALRSGLSVQQVTELDRAASTDDFDASVAGVRIWSRDKRLMYSDDPTRNARRPPGNVTKALAGKITASIDKDDSREFQVEGGFIDISMPLHFAREQRVEGVFELVLPYAPIAQRINSQTRHISIALVIGLALLWAALFRVVAGASKRLRKQANDRDHQARHDSLTQLPNRTYFYERLRESIRTARRIDMTLGVLMVDIERFRDVNDTLGHHNGDLLLRSVGERLDEVLEEGDFLSRFAGDTFAIMLRVGSSVARAEAAAVAARHSLEEPFVLDGLTLDIQVSIGAAVFPNHGTDGGVLMQHADVALNHAKTARSGYEFYDVEQDRHSSDRLALSAELRRGIKDDELVVYYQPQVDLRNGGLIGVEALVRWQHPKRGLVAPDEFIGIAESTGLIRPLTLKVLDTSLTECLRWEALGLKLSVSVNLSVWNLLDKRLASDIGELLERTGVAPNRLELEITESAIMNDPARALDALSRLSSMGVRLSVDDFGTGYSSLSYLKRLPVSALKIDRSFVMNMENDTNDAVIVRSTLDLARNLGLKTVAEGIETKPVMDELARLGCDVGQGYYISRPIPSTDLVDWAQERSGRNRAGLYAV